MPIIFYFYLYIIFILINLKTSFYWAQKDGSVNGWCCDEEGCPEVCVSSAMTQGVETSGSRISSWCREFWGP